MSSVSKIFPMRRELKDRIRKEQWLVVEVSKIFPMRRELKETKKGKGKK
jgi:hypothetical protein